MEVKISDREKEVLKVLVETYTTHEEGTCRYMKYIAEDCNLEISQVRRSLRSLARKGLAEYHRGLFDDDGMAAGSGYCASKQGALVFHACIDCKNQVSGMDDGRCVICWDRRKCDNCGRPYNEHEFKDGHRLEFVFSELEQKFIETRSVMSHAPQDGVPYQPRCARRI